MKSREERGQDYRREREREKYGEDRSREGSEGLKLGSRAVY